MQQIITAKLKLITTPEQFVALRQTQLAYRDALNAVSRYAFAQGKTSNVIRLHKGMYVELRTRYHLPSQLACSVERQVAATYKGLWTKLLKNREHLRAKLTKKRFKGLDQPPHYSSPTVQYTYERDYTFKCDQQVSVRTLNGRISLLYQGYDRHTTLIQHGASIGDAKLWYDTPKKTFYRLTDIRERTKRRKRKRKQNGNGYEQVSAKARKANRVYSQWSFAELQALISYKAALVGSLAIKVDADYTSQTCPMCGYRSEENRPHKGLLFACQHCQYRLHADLVGARNLTLRTLLVRHDWTRTGTLSMYPDTSDREAKAARLQRYAGLRWSPDATSLRLEAGGAN